MHNAKRIGVGTDIEQVKRFARVTHKSSFLSKIFTKSELTYCFSKGKPAQHLAGRYAAKEAIFKAISSIEAGLKGARLAYAEIEIRNDSNGIPVVKIDNHRFRDIHVYLSLSHCDDKAIAFAIVMGEEA